MSDVFISREQAESDLLACAAFIAERIKSADGRAEAMNAIVPMYLAKGDVDLAAELANSVDDPYSRDRLLTQVAEKCAEIDDEDYAIQLAEAIEDQGIGAQALERIAVVLAGSGKSERALEIADTMAHPDFVLTAVAIRRSADGEEAAANETLDLIDFPTARVAALQSIAAAFIEAGKTENAVSALDDAAASADGIEHEEERIRAMCDIGTLYLAAKRNDRSIETFDRARGYAEELDNTHRDLFLGTCSLGFLHAGSTDLAESTLDLVMDKTQMASALLGFAREAWRLDNKEDAVDSLEEGYAILLSQRDSETRDSRSRNHLLTSFAAQFAGFGKTERALEVARENPDPDERVSGLSQIAQILTFQKEYDLAREAINEIEADASRIYALIAVADERAKLGDAEAAISMLGEAESLSETVPQLAARSGVLNELIVRFVDHGLGDRARATAHENLAAIAQIRDESSQAASLAALAGVFESAGFAMNESELAQVRTLVRKISI